MVGKPCDWVQNNRYLFERLQCVKLVKVQSEFLPVIKGVPQGSILGSVLFTIYECQVHLYADDTIVYCIADSV